MTTLDATVAPAAAPPPAPARSRRVDDLHHGQIVIVTARWVLIGAGLALALWEPGSLGDVRVQLGAIFLLALVNFALHARLLQRRPAVEAFTYVASVADLGLISVLIMAQGGARSDLYVFYFPAILAFAVAFPRGVTLGLAGGVLALYALISLASGPPTEPQLQTLLVRLLMLAAVAAIGHFYQRLEDQRRATRRRAAA